MIHDQVLVIHFETLQKCILIEKQVRYSLGLLFLFIDFFIYPHGVTPDGETVWNFKYI